MNQTEQRDRGFEALQKRLSRLSADGLRINGSLAFTRCAGACWTWPAP